MWQDHKPHRVGELAEITAVLTCKVRKGLWPSCIVGGGVRARIWPEPYPNTGDGVFSPFQNATEHVGPDACGTQSWNLLDVELPLSRTQEPGVTLAPLKPWTQYAVFVRAITLTTAEDSPHQGAQSPIVYLRTLPAGELRAPE